MSSTRVQQVQVKERLFWECGERESVVWTLLFIEDCLSNSLDNTPSYISCQIVSDKSHNDSFEYSCQKLTYLASSNTSTTSELLLQTSILNKQLVTLISSSPIQQSLVIRKKQKVKKIKLIVVISMILCYCLCTANMRDKIRDNESA